MKLLFLKKMIHEDTYYYSITVQDDDKTMKVLSIRPAEEHYKKVDSLVQDLHNNIIDKKVFEKSVVEIFSKNKTTGVQMNDPDVNTSNNEQSKEPVEMFIKNYGVVNGIVEDKDDEFYYIRILGSKNAYKPFWKEDVSFQ